jgi:RNA polymerase sigma factor (sigma-70 family)
MPEHETDLFARALVLRPALHRYCSRLMGSVIDGEDVVQDTFARVLIAQSESYQVPQLRSWLYRIAHNRALDLLRSRTIRTADPHDAVALDFEVADDPSEVLMRQEAVRTAVSHFTELPILQRSVVILKDVLDEPLAEIAALLEITVDAVKGHLARGRARLQEIDAHSPPADAPAASAAVARYVTLFNQRNWDGLRALLADDVKLHQSLHPLRSGSADVARFFTIYATYPTLWLIPAWLEGREVIAVFEEQADPEPHHVMWLEWRDGLISFIRDYRYVGYVVDDAELLLAPGFERDRDAVGVKTRAQC